MHTDLRGRINSNAHAVAFDFQNGESDLITDDDRLVDSSRENEHGTPCRWSISVSRLRHYHGELLTLCVADRRLRQISHTATTELTPHRDCESSTADSMDVTVSRGG